MEKKWLFLMAFALILVVICFLSPEGYGNDKKWSCKEGGCELVLGGDYDTEEECKKSGCKLKETDKKVTFAKDLKTYYYGYQ